VISHDAQLHEEKLLHERMWTILGDAQLRAVVEKFGVEPFRRSSVVERFDAMLRDHGFEGKRCVEIGSWMGLTGIVLARYFEEVVSIDVHPNTQKHEIAGFLGVKNIRFIDVKDNVEKAGVIKAMNFDAAYVDGDHARDTFTDFALVERCQNVLFHEAWKAQPPVMKLLRQLADGGWTVHRRNKFAIAKR
jgi:predicted O-methyltransferase YrrM